MHFGIYLSILGLGPRNELLKVYLEHTAASHMLEGSKGSTNGTKGSSAKNPKLRYNEISQWFNTHLGLKTLGMTLPWDVRNKVFKKYPTNGRLEKKNNLSPQLLDRCSHGQVTGWPWDHIETLMQFMGLWWMTMALKQIYNGLDWPHPSSTP